MRDRSRDATGLPDPCCDGARASRRDLLKAGAGLAAGGAALPLLAGGALAQNAPDAELERLQRSRRILIKGAIVLSQDRQVGDFAPGDVLIEDGKIREVGPSIAAGDVAVIDGTNRIVIPGFVDTHSHSYQGLLRNSLNNGILADYNRDIQGPLTAAYQADDAYAGVLIAALGFIDMGATTIVDISQVCHTPEHSDACIRALQEAGIRAVYAYYRGQGPGNQYPQDIKRLAPRYFNSKDQLLTLALGVNLDPKLYTLAREVGVPAVTHINSLDKPLKEVAGAGLLRPGDEYIHCTRLNDESWRTIKDSGGRISISIAIEMMMGQGAPAIQDALDHGVRPSLSSDHGATIAQDFFSVMRAALMLQHHQILDRIRKGEKDNLPPLLTSREVLEFATIEGARCASLDGRIGSLTPGKDADIVLLRADGLSTWPINNASGMVVNIMNPSHIESVFIAGKVRKWRGSLVGVDASRVRRLVEDARNGVVRRAGLQVNVLG